MPSSQDGTRGGLVRYSPKVFLFISSLLNSSLNYALKHTFYYKYLLTKNMGPLTWSISGPFSTKMVLEKLHFFFYKSIFLHRAGLWKRVNRSTPVMCNFHLSLPVTLGSRLRKDCQTDLVNLCQGRDYDFYSSAGKGAKFIISLSC